jgi:hypothetical protein
MEFSTKIFDKWKEVLSKESIDLIEYAQQKIIFAILDLNAYYYAIGKIKESYTEWIKPLFEKGRVSNFPDSNVEYCSTQVPSDVFFNKINFSFYSSIHSFFDNYGQFMCSCLFPARPESVKFYFNDVYKELGGNSTFLDIFNKVQEFKRKNIFQYITDIDNVNKHRYTVSPLVTTWLNDGEITTELPEFIKEKRRHNKTDMVDNYEDSLDLAIEFYNKVTPLIIQYLNAKNKT